MNYGGYRDVYSNMSPYVERAPTVRLAMYIGPTGLAFIMLSALIASASWVCNEECVQSAERRSERLLDCEERCQAPGSQGFRASSLSCKQQCLNEVQYTVGRVRRQELQCKKDCIKSPLLMKFLAFCGTLLLMVVTPLLGSYKGSCRCECCIGEGCNARLALLNLAWVFYGFSTLWVLPTVLEDQGEVGGKVLFSLTQGLAMALMFGSREMADRAIANGSGPPGAPRTGAPHSSELGVIVGAPVSGLAAAELQQQVKELQEQVRELVRLQTLQVSKQTPQQVAASDGAGVAAQRPTAVAAAVAPPHDAAPKELL
mmetsp:Transcript_118407/g.331583  ORF Transcript_118407/g.331583 Transcript_118407/m.331583 type:complete len:314 (+) Transcript_118407:166-1107(+)